MSDTKERQITVYKTEDPDAARKYIDIVRSLHPDPELAEQLDAVEASLP